jgi:hypothetical protein
MFLYKELFGFLIYNRNYFNPEYNEKWALRNYDFYLESARFLNQAVWLSCTKTRGGRYPSLNTRLVVMYWEISSAE